MLSRRAISWISVAITVAAYGALLWLAPQITLLKADRLASRINTRFRVELTDAPPESVDTFRTAGGGDISQRSVESLFSTDPGTLTVEDSMAAPPVETPQLDARLAEESVQRAYDLASEPERARKMDARILEITAEAARREINISRRLVRPSPEFTLPAEAMPALRSRDVGPEDIALEPARIGAGLLAQAISPADDQPPDAGESEKPPFEAMVVDSKGEQEGTDAATQLEQTVVSAPVEKETQKAREQSVYSFLDDMVDIQLETYTPADGQPGYFRLRILPRKDADISPLPRDFIFVVDASRSVQQRKLDLVTRGISDALQKFRVEDRFNILVFRDAVTSFLNEPVHAEQDAVTAALSFLSGMESRGQTDVYNALLPVARITPRANIPGIVLVVSDGVPTTGIRDSRTIINAFTDDNGLRNSVFAYGAGNTVNRYLLDLLAYRNKGEAFISGNIQQAREDIAAFIARLANPILVNLKTEYGSSVRGEVYPRIVPDFYKDRPITLYGRFDPKTDEAFAARITGHAGELKKELVFRVSLEEARKGGQDIAQGWAFEKAYHIIGEISRRGELPELLEELRDISRRYNIRTIYDEN
ncbi:MAG TPA: VWA domain-containing protein [Candidatus Hydrogenedentes bacterium]|nr:VWA domain-containing protein [Candidatus Hydrogenedentota bacterium]